ncbi:MAG: lamin tail domain-containing protein [Alphaproteobacteria bacterium]|nr:lamin tail domain-containing protein [Alphaproteobacteria bacterium]MCB9699796.1 lamin tail domain-containing protein [Alphaproteobacteria bacterium]
MRTMLSVLVAAAALVACGVEEGADSNDPRLVGDGAYLLDGDMPADVDLDEALAMVPPGGFGIVADPRTGEVATLVSSSSPLARDANGEFTVSVGATCPDCGDPTCAVTNDRTLEITLNHASGSNGETFTVSTASAQNFVSPTSGFSPDASPNVGADMTVSTVGTLPSCSTFSYYFNVVGPDVPVETILFSEYVEGSSGNNKFVEVQNTGNVGFDLTGCQIRLYSNGAAAPSATFTLNSTTLAVGDVYLLCHSGASFVPGGACDQSSGSLSFNGDDALDLVCGATTYDIIGQIGNRPSPNPPGWGALPLATADSSIKRDCAITVGDTNGADAFDPADEWVAQTQNDVSNLGIANTCP